MATDVIKRSNLVGIINDNVNNATFSLPAIDTPAVLFVARNNNNQGIVGLYVKDSWRGISAVVPANDVTVTSVDDKITISCSSTYVTVIIIYPT